MKKHNNCVYEIENIFNKTINNNGFIKKKKIIKKSHNVIRLNKTNKTG